MFFFNISKESWNKFSNWSFHDRTMEYIQIDLSNNNNWILRNLHYSYIHCAKHHSNFPARVTPFGRRWKYKIRFTQRCVIDRTSLDERTNERTKTESHSYASTCLPVISIQQTRNERGNVFTTRAHLQKSHFPVQTYPNRRGAIHIREVIKCGRTCKPGLFLMDRKGLIKKSYNRMEPRYFCVNVNRACAPHPRQALNAAPPRVRPYN